MAQPQPERLESTLLDLYGGDAFAHIREASDAHREEHGADCGVFPSGPIKMRLIASLVRAAGATRVLEIGAGLGYSALWLALAIPPQGAVHAIDRFPEHVELARRYAREADLADRLHLMAGDSTEVMSSLQGPYDLVHDDGWFAREPPHLQRCVDLLRPGGLLVMSNWFLLEEALSQSPQPRWAQFAGPDWADDVQAYARRLATHPQLALSFAMRPWLGLAVKTT